MAPTTVPNAFGQLPIGVNSVLAYVQIACRKAAYAAGVPRDQHKGQSHENENQPGIARGALREAIAVGLVYRGADERRRIRLRGKSG